MINIFGFNSLWSWYNDFPLLTWMLLSPLSNHFKSVPLPQTSDCESPLTCILLLLRAHAFILFLADEWQDRLLPTCISRKILVRFHHFTTNIPSTFSENTNKMYRSHIGDPGILYPKCCLKDIFSKYKRRVGARTFSRWKVSAGPEQN